MDPRQYIGKGEMPCCEPEMPITPIHELLVKMNELAIDIRDGARYIDTSMFPINPNKCGEVLPLSENPDNMYDHIKRILNELVIANDTLNRVRNRL